MKWAMANFMSWKKSRNKLVADDSEKYKMVFAV